MVDDVFSKNMHPLEYAGQRIGRDLHWIIVLAGEWIARGIIGRLVIVHPEVIGKSPEPLSISDIP